MTELAAYVQEVGQAVDPLLGMDMIIMISDGDIMGQSYEQRSKRFCSRNLYMRGPMVEDVLHTMESDMV